MSAPIALPFNPGGIEYLGGITGVGGMQQLITALQQSASPVFGPTTYNALANAAGQTLTVAQVLGGLLVRSGAAGISDTMPTAALLFASWPGAQIGSTAPLLYVNLNSGTMTLVTAAGITLAGTTTVVTTGARVYQLLITACPVNIISLSYANNVVTVTTNAPHGLAAGGNAIVANMSNAGFNGTFVISTVPNAYQLTYPLTTAVAFGGSTPNAVIPSVGAQTPGLLNTAVAMTMQGAFAWPAILIA